MENVPIPADMVQDPPAVNRPEIAHIVGRDPERTPMQWDASPYAGFASPSSKRPWPPVASNFREVNVARQLDDPTSMLNLYRKLLELRKSTPALQSGDYHSLHPGSTEAEENCFVYERQAGEQRVVVALNFSAQEQKLSLPLSGTGRIVLSTFLDREGVLDLSDFHLRANEGYIIVTDKSSIPSAA